ncbi:N-acetyltransferase 9-like protein [Euroglyphus maynei]|uniref:N-acetyltransferase 9-like protein n=1 Tax=Euroglyphus maynei TaxID=6958 RepID=A0A1Y3ARI0_EURMA|nr:N-acetyltransferase 9-like protein [Euroglyphus maynei]
MSTLDSVLVKNVEIKQQKHQIWSDRLMLVPYRSHHVPRYNEWMQDPHLQYLTGSEPLTLEDEYKMLESWNNDPEKCTFIILDRKHYESEMMESALKDQNECEVQSMIGDVNLFICHDHDVDNNDNEPVAEIEIMIAEQRARRKGYGREATMLMLKFGHEILGIRKFRAKIKTSNIHSQRMFSEIFGFVEYSRSTVFDEITYVCDLIEPNHRLRQMFDESDCHYKIC